MMTPDTIERGLAQLGEELGTQTCLAQRVLEEIRSRAAAPPLRHDGPRIWFSRRRLFAAAALGLLISVGTWWVSTPAPVYARVLEALERAQTVHLTGWTRDVSRKWPLENPVSGADDSKVRHTVEAWYWTESSGEPASYERFGQVIRVRRGGSLREYQADVELLFISEGRRSRNDVERFATLAEYLKALNGSLSKAKLEPRQEGNRTLNGWRVTQGNRIEEFWLDAHSDLPVRFSRSLTQAEGNVPVFELTLSFNEPIPADVVRYEPPQTKNIRYGGTNANAQLAWRQHVQELGRRLQDEPIPGRVALLPRANSQTFNVQWVLKTPDGKFWVAPLDFDQYQRMPLSSFFSNRAATASGEWRHGTWRVPREFHNLELRHDLVYADGTPERDWVSVVLDHFGLEFVDVEVERTVWIARHDGRQLKPWQEVHPPVAYMVRNGVEQKGLVDLGIGHLLHPVTMDELFQDFNSMIDRDELSARRPIIFDETGLPKPPPFDAEPYKTGQEFRDKVVTPRYCVASDAPYFVGTKSLAMARNWYAKEFGVTFAEEQRKVTVHVVRKKGTAK